MNPLYQMFSGGGPQFQNPMQKMNFIMQAMQNPAMFVKRQFPDIPDNISNDPNQILRYIQQTRGISDQQIQQLYSMYRG